MKSNQNQLNVEQHCRGYEIKIFKDMTPEQKKHYMDMVEQTIYGNVNHLHTVAPKMKSVNKAKEFVSKVTKKAAKDEAKQEKKHGDSKKESAKKGKKK